MPPKKFKCPLKRFLFKNAYQKTDACCAGKGSAHAGVITPHVVKHLPLKHVAHAKTNVLILTIVFIGFKTLIVVQVHALKQEHAPAFLLDCRQRKVLLGVRFTPETFSSRAHLTKDTLEHFLKMSNRQAVHFLMFKVCIVIKFYAE